MNDRSQESAQAGDGVTERWPELLVAAFLLVIACLVIADSLRVGIGWADDGPRSGYFPFYIGLLLLGSSGFIFVKSLLSWRKESPLFAEREQISLVMSMLVPMVIYVGGIWLLGIYVASLLLIGFFMRHHGKFGWGLSAAVAVGVPLAFFLVFERWFLVPLPKGPIENMLGF
jgi:putative tricarboxylic transport membrane protein